MLTYKTTPADDNYLLLKNNSEVGKLSKSNKVNRLDSTIKGTINNTSINFLVKGNMNPTIEIIDGKSNKKEGVIKINNAFVFFPKAELIFSGGKNYQWSSDGIFNYSWEWKKKENSKPILFSLESSNTRCKMGKIFCCDDDDFKEILMIAGLHLRDVVNRKTLLMQFFVAVIIFVIFLGFVFFM